MNLHLETQKVFTGSDAGKPLMVSNTEAPGGSCVFCLVTLEKHSPKCPSTLFKETTDKVPQQKSSWFSWWLTFSCHNWIKMTIVLFLLPLRNTEKAVTEKAIMSKLHIYSRNFSIAQTGQQRKRWNRTSSICLQNSSPSLYNYILFISKSIPRLTSGNFSSSQPKSCYMRRSQTQK